jgi:hypothetical protein
VILLITHDTEVPTGVVFEGQHFAHIFIDEVRIKVQLEQVYTLADFETTLAVSVQHHYMGNHFRQVDDVPALGIPGACDE